MKDKGNEVHAELDKKKTGAVADIEKTKADAEQRARTCTAASSTELEECQNGDGMSVLDATAPWE